MAKSPDQIVADIDRQQNEEDLDLIPRAGRMLKEKLNEDLIGGAYVGSRLNMPSNTRLGKMSAGDTALLNKYDKSSEGVKAKIKRDYGMKAGGKISKTDMQQAGFYEKGKTKSERQAIVSKVTTKPQRVAIVEKAFSTKNMKAGGMASKRADGIAIRGKTKA